MPQTYCTSAHVLFVLGESGMAARVDDDESGVASVEEEAHITTAISWAASDINQAVGKQYKLSEVTANTMLQMANAYLAAERLCQRRGNEPPPMLTEQCDKIRERLNEIKYGRAQLPEQNDSFETYPTVSNFDVRIGSWYGPIFVDPLTSTNSPPAEGITRKYAWHWGWF